MTDDHGPGTLPAAGEPGAEPPLRPEHYAGGRNLIEHAPLRPLPEREPDEPEPDDEPAPDIEPELPAAGGPTPPRREHSRKPAVRLTKRSRRDLDAELTAMCQTAGWRSTTLNPDLDARQKMTIMSVRFGQLAAESHPEALYVDLLGVAAGALGWAQSIQRRVWRAQKRAQRARKREQRKRNKRKREKRK